MKSVRLDVGDFCMERYPCLHDCTVVIDDQKTKRCFDGDDLWVLVQNLNPESVSWGGRVDPETRHRLYEHLRDYSDHQLTDVEKVFRDAFGDAAPTPEVNHECAEYLSRNAISEKEMRQAEEKERHDIFEDCFVKAESMFAIYKRSATSEEQAMAKEGAGLAILNAEAAAKHQMMCGTIEIGQLVKLVKLQEMHKELV
ncbi:MAG: hypothetical protein KDK78_01495 [Chlamydiia bacterium]|nr:hypothetical protein [Chlamydiia bacterium]